MFSAYCPDRHTHELPSDFGGEEPIPNYLFFPNEAIYFNPGEAKRQFKVRIYPENAGGDENSYPISQGWPEDRIIIAVVGRIGYLIPSVYPLSVVDIDIDPVPNTQGSWPVQTDFSCILKDYPWTEITDEDATGKLISPLFGASEPSLIYDQGVWTLNPADFPGWENEVDPGIYDIRISFQVGEVPNDKIIEVDCPVIVYEPAQSEHDSGIYFVDYLSKRKGSYGLYRTTIIPSSQGSQAKHTEVYYEPGWNVQNHSVSEDGSCIAFDLVQGSGASGNSRIMIATMDLQDVISVNEFTPFYAYEDLVYLGYGGSYVSSIVAPAASHPVISPDGRLLVFQVDFQAVINYPAVPDPDPGDVHDFSLSEENRQERFVRTFGIALVDGHPQYPTWIFEVYDQFQDRYAPNQFQYFYDSPYESSRRPVPREQFSCWGPSVTKCNIEFTGFIDGQENPTQAGEGVAIFVNTDVDLNGDFDNLLHNPPYNIHDKYMRIVKKGSTHIGCGLYDVSGWPQPFDFYYIIDQDNKYSISSGDFEAERIYLQGLGINENNLLGHMTGAANVANPRVDPDGYILTAEMIEMYPTYTVAMSLGEDGPAHWGDNGICRNITEENYLVRLPWVWRAKSDRNHLFQFQSGGGDPLIGGITLPAGPFPGADRHGITPSGTIFVFPAPNNETSRRARVIYHAGIDILGSTYITEYFLNHNTDDGLLVETVTLNLAHTDIFNLGLGYDNSPAASPDGHAFVFTSQYLSDGDLYFVYLIPDALPGSYSFNAGDLVKLRLTNDACNTSPKISGKVIP